MACLAVAAAAAFSLPLTAAFTQSSIAIALKVALAAVLAGSALLPAAGLAAVLVLVPLAFLALITVPFVYEWRRGGLEWD